MLPILPVHHGMSEVSDRVLHGQIPPKTIVSPAFADSWHLCLRMLGSGSHAGGSEATLSTVRSGQRLRFDEPSLDITLDDQLRDAVPRVERHGVFRIKIDQRHLDFATVARVNGSRCVQHGNALFDGKTGPWMYQGHITRWKRYRHSRRHQRPLERLQCDFLGGTQIGAGIPGHKLHNSIGVMKAYSSCVGDGPFAAELAMTEEEKHALREAGHEYGAATGRPRRVGPIDLVASRYGVFCQGCDEVALTLLDVLDYMEKIPMVTAYKLTDGTTTTRFPMGEALDTAQPVVEYLPGWHCDITAARKWEDLPQQARDYVEYLEKAVGCKITYISVGAEREAYIHRG